MVVLFTLVYWLGGTAFLRLLTSDAEVVQAAATYLPWVLLIPIAGMAAFIWDGVFIGITATRGMLVSSMIATCIFFAGVTGLMGWMGNHGLWLSMILFLAARGGVQTYLYHRTLSINP
jgi:MATE family multidrug resistance protein